MLKVAAITLAALATCGNARANEIMSCSGVMEGPGLSTKQAHLSVTIDPVRKTVMIDGASSIPIEGDTTGNTITFGDANSPTFGILDRKTGSLFMSTFQPVTTYSGICSQVGTR